MVTLVPPLWPMKLLNGRSYPNEFVTVVMVLDLNRSQFGITRPFRSKMLMLEYGGLLVMKTPLGSVHATAMSTRSLVFSMSASVNDCEKAPLV